MGNLYRADFTTSYSDSSVADSQTYLLHSESGNWHMQSSYKGTTLYAYSSNMIDVTNLKKLKYTMVMNRNCPEYEFAAELSFGLASTKDLLDNNFDVLSNLKIAKNQTTTSNQIVYQDVSGLTGSRYLKFNLYHGEETNGCTGVALLYNIEGIY